MALRSILKKTILEQSSFYIIWHVKVLKLGTSTLVKYYKKLVNCEKIIQKWVSIYETCECDIGAQIHRFSWIDGLSTGPPG